MWVIVTRRLMIIAALSQRNGKAAPLQCKKVTKRLALNAGFTSSHPCRQSPTVTNMQTMPSLALWQTQSRESLNVCVLYRAITQREWKSYTCLNLALMPNKFQLPVKQQTETSQPSRKLWSDISTHAFQVHYIQQHHCMGPAQRTCG